MVSLQMINSNKKAIVTGGSRGIGKAIALKFAELGSNVAINYRKESEELNAFIEELREKGCKVIGIKGDVSSFDDTKNMVDEVVKEFGRIDILVNNAGITKDTLLIRMKENDFDYFYSLYLLPDNACSPKDYETILNLIEKGIFKPIEIDTN